MRLLLNKIGCERNMALQVVGRVHKGHEVLQQLSEARMGDDEQPEPPITLAACGLTNFQVSGLIY